VPQEGPELLLELREGIEVVEEDGEHPLDTMAVTAELDATVSAAWTP
jgi:hypothetical protein